MPIEHVNIPDDKRHEPKGISTATEGQVYRSDGSASGLWKDDIISLNAVLDDVSETSFVLIPIPSNCEVLRIKATLANAITVADSTLTITRGGDDLTLASLIIPFTSSAEGTTVNVVPLTNTSLIMDTNNYIKVASDGGSTTASKLFISVKVKVTE